MEFRRKRLFISSYDDRPSHLFSGLDKNTLSILLFAEPSQSAKTMTTRLCRWNSDERDVLFDLIEYNSSPICRLNGCIPKIGNSTEAIKPQAKMASANMLAAGYYFLRIKVDYGNDLVSIYLNGGSAETLEVGKAGDISGLTPANFGLGLNNLLGTINNNGTAGSTAEDRWVTKYAIFNKLLSAGEIAIANAEFTI